jgi:hypothetical protein
MEVHKVWNVAVDKTDSQPGEALPGGNSRQGATQLPQDMAALFLDMPFSDVKFEVQGKVLKAHKNILWSKLVIEFNI